jgi:hypothetical protein
MTNDEVMALASELAEDGATHELADGRELAVSIGADEQEVLYGDRRRGGVMETDDEYLGKFAWVERDRYNDHDRERPAGFDGNAEILSVGRGGDRLWWQPSKDAPSRYNDADGFRAVRRAVLQLLEYGYSYVRLELRDAERDAYGRRIVRAVAGTYGVTLSDTYREAREEVAFIVADLIHEVMAEVDATA